MVSDPVVIVTCDCCKTEYTYNMTPLVCRSWDLRDLKKALERDGWELEDGLDGETLCDGCVGDRELEQ